MKFKAVIAFLASICLSLWAYGQEQVQELPKTNYLTQNGRINLVVFALTIIFVGIILYLIRLERKLNKLEKENS